MSWDPATLPHADSVYATAFSLYEQDQYTHALPLFTQLVLQAPFNKDYWQGLAACQQMLGSYKEALRAWAFAALLTEDDPEPHFHAAECLFSLNDTKEAMLALTAARRCLQDTPDHVILRGKIELLEAGLCTSPL